MHGFKRNHVDAWHREVPGARWFKADLHVHTLDDLPGRRVKVPAEVVGTPSSKEGIRSYARLLLQAAVQRGVRVLALTPHSARMGEAGESSAVWGIVDEWNDGVDEDGEPFRHKIYAVFPGFEPSLGEGQSGLHLLFLFDPEIGRTNYLRAFDLVMDQRLPWRQNQLKLSGKTAAESLDALRDFQREGDGKSAIAPPSTWDYLVLAPHIDSAKGIFGAEKGQILERFPVEEIAGLELPDEKLPEDAWSNRLWLREGLHRQRHAFFHGSDAYSPEDIGHRFTWVKLAQPRIEGLRQAFLAADSRIRIAYRRDDGGELAEIEDPPDVTVSGRPWLKSVRISGGASFFRGQDGDETQFALSPDLTCIIGGSMTGKSTLLDGLRVHSKAPMPKDDHLKQQVQGRARDRFLAGSASVELECPGQDPTGAAHEQWPAVFYAQNELQRLAQDPNAIEDILSRLVATETDGIRKRAEKLGTLDVELVRLAKRLDKLDQEFADAEQGADRAKRAAEQLAAFAAAGIDELHDASASHNRWRHAAAAAATALSDAKAVRVADLPEDLDDLPLVATAVAPEARAAIRQRIVEARQQLSFFTQGLADVNALFSDVMAALEKHVTVVRENLERRLAESGFDGAAIKEFGSLSRQAALVESREALLQELRHRRGQEEGVFGRLLADRNAVVEEQRCAFDRVMDAIHGVDGRIQARRQSNGIWTPLEEFLVSLKQRGITRWWNELENAKKPSPQELLDGLRHDGLAALGMSEAVQETFRDVMVVPAQRALAAIRCEDSYLLEFELERGEYRRLEDLSGGQRVSVLLSLLLNTMDSRPLVIDQPEDELDNRFLFDAVLPALKRLKGHRQVIVATHNPNIVVNGDADQVIQLDASANNGWIAKAGAIEDAAVRDAIMHTVDGGADAFRLRRMKYGF